MPDYWITVAIPADDLPEAEAKSESIADAFQALVVGVTEAGVQGYLTLVDLAVVAVRAIKDAPEDTEQHPRYGEGV